jgi:hypothetical protein
MTFNDLAKKSLKNAKSRIEACDGLDSALERAINENIGSRVDMMKRLWTEQSLLEKDLSPFMRLIDPRALCHALAECAGTAEGREAVAKILEDAVRYSEHCEGQRTELGPLEEPA